MSMNSAASPLIYSCSYPSEGRGKGFESLRARQPHPHKKKGRLKSRPVFVSVGRRLLFLFLGLAAEYADDARLGQRMEIQLVADEPRRRLVALGELQLVFIDRRHRDVIVMRLAVLRRAGAAITRRAE